MKNKPDRLTGLIRNWQMSGEGYREIIYECSYAVCNYPKKYYNWDQDLCAEFYIFFYPCLIKLLQNYAYNGKSFYAILNHTIAWQLKTFYRRRKKQLSRECCIEDYSINEFKNKNVENSSKKIFLTPEASERLGIGKNGRISKKSLARKLVMLVLKNALFIDEDDLDEISDIVGWEKAWLINSIRILKAKCEDRINRFNAYKLRANKAYMDLCLIQEAIRSCVDKNENQKLLIKQDVLKHRLETAIYRKNTVKYCPKNSEIADVMGIPKGTVDSGLFYFKRFLRDL